MTDYELKDDLLYDKNDNWIIKNENKIVFGISDFALKKADEIIFIELPEVGRKVAMGEAIGSIESSKWSGELYAPVSGVLSKVNMELEDAPETMNDSPYDHGWICEIELDTPEELDKLLDIKAYKERIGK